MLQYHDGLQQPSKKSKGEPNQRKAQSVSWEFQKFKGTLGWGLQAYKKK